MKTTHYTYHICQRCGRGLGRTEWRKPPPTPSFSLCNDCLTELKMDTFIQPKITGYRQLTEEEAILMNEGKELSEAVGRYIELLRIHPDKLDQRWISIGATQIQQGFMAVMRGIAQPTTF